MYSNGRICHVFYNRCTLNRCQLDTRLRFHWICHIQVCHRVHWVHRHIHWPCWANQNYIGRMMQKVRAAWVQTMNATEIPFHHPIAINTDHDRPLNKWIWKKSKRTTKTWDMYVSNELFINWHNVYDEILIVSVFLFCSCSNRMVRNPIKILWLMMHPKVQWVQCQMRTTATVARIHHVKMGYCLRKWNIQTDLGRIRHDRAHLPMHRHRQTRKWKRNPRRRSRNQWHQPIQTEPTVRFQSINHILLIVSAWDSD